MIEGKELEGQVTDEGKTLLAQLLLKDTTTYTIHLFTTGDTPTRSRGSTR